MLASEGTSRHQTGPERVMSAAVVLPAEAVPFRIWTEAVPPEIIAAADMRAGRACLAHLVAAVVVAVAAAAAEEGGNYDYGSIIIKQTFNGDKNYVFKNKYWKDARVVRHNDYYDDYYGFCQLCDRSFRTENFCYR
jgi:hypothetical protein